MKSKTASGGFTLFELLIVLIILGIAAKVAIPFFSSSDDERLDVAASEVVSALRFARSEALRTGSWHRFELTSGATPQLRVYRISSSTYLEDTANPVNHPIDKSTYRFLLKDRPYTSGIAVTGKPTIAGFPVTTVNFCTPSLGPACACGSGVPVHISDPFFGIVTANCYVAGQNAFTVSLNGKKRNVVLDPVTGRITVNS
ncbi:MAG: prepilin-type N-terminal cleavage/methylation domain-containing protein [Burkholderiales bacterium]